MSRMTAPTCLGDRHGHQHGGGHGLTVGTIPAGVAVTPDGTHAYVTNDGSNTVSVIDTATNTVGDDVTVGSLPFGSPSPRTANTPMSRMNSTRHRFGDRHGHQHGGGHGRGGEFLCGRRHPGWETRLCPEWLSITVSVIDTATNTVERPRSRWGLAPGVGIVPPPPGVPFLAFNAVLNIHFGTAPNTDAFQLGPVLP